MERTLCVNSIPPYFPIIWEVSGDMGTSKESSGLSVWRRVVETPLRKYINEYLNGISGEGAPSKTYMSITKI